MKSYAHVVLLKILFASSSSSSIVLYLCEKCVSISFFTPAWLAICAAVCAVRCLYCSAFSSSALEKLASDIIKSESFTSSYIASHGSVSSMNDTFFPFTI